MITMTVWVKLNQICVSCLRVHTFFFTENTFYCLHTSHSDVDSVAFLSSHFAPVFSTVWCLKGVCNFAGSGWRRPVRRTCFNIFFFDFSHHSPSSQPLQSLTADLNGIIFKVLLPVLNNLRESFIYNRDTEKQILIIMGLNCQKFEINLFSLNNINTAIQIWLLLTSCLRAAEVNLYDEQQQHHHHWRDNIIIKPAI